MKAVVYHEFGGLITIETVPDPSPEPDGAVIQVDATGLCAATGMARAAAFVAFRQRIAEKPTPRRCHKGMHYSHIALAACLAAAQLLTAFHADACTVFTITDGRQILFCDNEDFSNPHTRVWFVPGTATRNGCVFLGFDDGWGQNGLNDKGLAYGWVAGFKERWERQPGMKTVHGKPCHQMLQSCATIQDAIAFFEQHWEESFSYGRLLIADRSGKSAIISATDGKLHAPIVTRSQGMGHRFGMRGNEAAGMLAEINKPTLPDAVRLLNFTRQEGVNATKYSVVFDLKTCDVHLYRFPDQRDPVRFKLSQELHKTPHYYDIPKLPKQLNQSLLPLTKEMKQN
jgi:hypothetical protein